MKNQSDKDIDRKIDNELKKKALEKKYGAMFGGTTDLPLEIEKQWLDHIEAFEEKYENAERIKIFKLIGEPKFKPEHELTDEVFSHEIDRLYQVLIENDIALDTLAEVDDREIYRFITEELFYEEVDDMKIPGLRSCFIYEDFHPNARLDIELSIDNFMNFTLGKYDNISGNGYDLAYVDTENFINADGKQVPEKQIVKQINDYLKSYDSFEILKQEIVDIQINEDETDATVKMNLNYNAWIENGKIHQNYCGIATFKLVPSIYGGWGIYQIDMPGWFDVK
ncbi:MAG: hypothetical protein U9N51_09450 [Bacteroidota bacterium]|nr:hypothetical protein [Bacteroidota bacterium]